MRRGHVGGFGIENDRFGEACLSGGLPELFERRDEPVKTDGRAHAADALFRVESGQVVVAAARAYRADLGQVVQEGFVDDTGVIVEAAGDGRVEYKGRLDADRFHQGADLPHAFRVFGRAAGHFFHERQGCLKVFRPVSGALDVREDVGSSVFSRNLRKERRGFVGTDLGKLVHRAEDIFAFVRKAARRKEAVEDAAVGDFYRDLFHADGGKGRFHEREDFKVHRFGVRPDDVEVALEELAVAAGLRFFAAPDLGDVIAFEGEVELVLVGGDKPREGDRQVEAEGNVAPAVIGKPEYLFFGFPVALAQKDFGVFKGRRIDGHESEGAETRRQFFDEQRAGGFFRGQCVAETFQYSGLYQFTHGAMIPTCVQICNNVRGGSRSC